MRPDGRSCCEFSVCRFTVVKKAFFNQNVQVDILSCILHQSPPSAAALFPSLLFSRPMENNTETFLPQPEALWGALAGSSAGRETWYLPEPWLFMSEFNYSAGVELWSGLLLRHLGGKPGYFYQNDSLGAEGCWDSAPMSTAYPPCRQPTCRPPWAKMSEPLPAP